MPATAAFAPVARPYQAAALLLGMRPVGRGVIARSVPLAFACLPEATPPPVPGPWAVAAAHWYGAGDTDRSSHRESA